MKNHKPTVLAGVLLLQAFALITAQTSVDPIDAELKENRGLKLSTEAPADCPHCNVMSEVSESTIFSREIRKMTKNTPRGGERLPCADRNVVLVSLINRCM
jgi:hypothetical protein